MSLKKKILAALAIIVAVWILTPIPEGAILMSVIFGGSAAAYGLPWQWVVGISLASFPVTFYLLRRWRVLEKLKAMFQTDKKMKN